MWDTEYWIFRGRTELNSKPVEDEERDRSCVEDTRNTLGWLFRKIEGVTCIQLRGLLKLKFYCCFYSSRSYVYFFNFEKDLWRWDQLGGNVFWLQRLGVRGLERRGSVQFFSSRARNGKFEKMETRYAVAVASLRFFMNYMFFFL